MGGKSRWRRRAALAIAFASVGCTGAFKGPMYSPPYRMDRDEVVEACERFRKDVEENSGMWSLTGYSMLGVGTAFVAGGSAAAATTDDSTMRIVYISGAALGAVLLVFSRSAFEKSLENSSASASVARALREPDPQHMNAACLDADVAMRFGTAAQIQTRTVVTVRPTPAQAESPSGATDPARASSDDESAVRRNGNSAEANEQAENESAQ